MKLTLLILIMSCLLISQSNGQITKPVDDEVKYIEPDRLRVPDCLGVKSIEIDFSSPTPGSPAGVCIKKFPVIRTPFPDEMLNITGQVILEVDLLKELDDESGFQKIELELPLVVSEFQDMNVVQYDKKLEDFKAKREKLLLSMIKESLEKERFVGKQLSDEDLLKLHGTDQAKMKLEEAHLKCVSMSFGSRRSK